MNIVKSLKEAIIKEVRVMDDWEKLKDIHDHIKHFKRWDKLSVRLEEEREQQLKELRQAIGTKRYNEILKFARNKVSADNLDFPPELKCLLEKQFYLDLDLQDASNIAEKVIREKEKQVNRKKIVAPAKPL